MILDYLMQSIFKDREGYISRKLSASYFLSILNTCLLCVGSLNPDNYTILMTTIWAAYFGVDTLGSVSYNKTRQNNLSDDSSENTNDIGN